MPSEKSPWGTQKLAFSAAADSRFAEARSSRSAGSSRGNTGGVDGERAFKDHLELPAGVEEHDRAPTMVTRQDRNRDYGRGAANPQPHNSSRM